MSIVVLVILSVLATLISPAASSAYTGSTPSATPTPSRAVGDYIGDYAGDGSIRLNGTTDMAHLAFVSYRQPGASCYYTPMSPWAMLLNVDTGQQIWSHYVDDSDGGDTFTYRTVHFGGTNFGAPKSIPYPGGTFRLYLFNDSTDCNNLNQQPDFATSIPTFIGKDFEVTWEDMRVHDSYYYTATEARVRTTQTGEEGGISTYAIYNYGKPDQRVRQSSYPSYQQCIYPKPTALSCTANTGYAQEDAIGFAIIPNVDPNQKYDGTQWPPPGAISHSVASKIAMGYTVDKDLTQGGTSKSTNIPQPSTADPINTYSGHFYTDDTDLDVHGRIGLDFERYYSVGNLGSEEGDFGKGWTMGYDMHIVDDGSTATLVEENGSRVAFNSSGDGYTRKSLDVRASLVRTDTGWEFQRWNSLKKYVFDSSGYLTKIEDNNSNSVDISRDSYHDVTSVTEGTRSLTVARTLTNKPLTVTDNSGRQVSYSYDSEDRLSSVTDPNGNFSAYGYDSMDRIISVTTASGVLTNTYDTRSRINTQTMPSGRTFTMSYGTPDAYGRVTNTETSGTNIKKFSFLKGRISHEWDQSDTSKEAWYYYDNKGQLDSKKYADDGVHEILYTYDDKGNAILIEDLATGATDSMQWNDAGQVTRHQNSSGVTTENVYDPSGNLTTTKIIPSSGGNPRVTSIDVAPNGDVEAIVNPLGGTTTIEHTDDGDVETSTDPVGGRTTYTYDSVGRNLSKMSPGGNVTGVAPNEASKFLESYSYDANGNVTAATNQSGVTSYQYNSKDDLVSITGPRGKSKGTAYDADGKMTAITYPDNTTELFTYDPSTGAVATWTDTKGRTTAYSQNGEKKTTTSPDGVSTSIIKSITWDYKTIDTYLIDGSKPAIRVSHAEPKSGSVNSGSRTDYYSKDAQGRITLDATAAGRGEYSYNGFGELASRTNTTPGRNVSYQYDVAGNIIQITYPDGTHIARSVDVAGRTTSITDWSGVRYTVTYTGAGQIEGLVSSAGLRYEMDYDGTRPVSKEWHDSLNQMVASFGSQYEASGLIESDSKAVAGVTSARDFTWGDLGNLASVNATPITWDGKYLTSNESFQNMDYEALTGRLASVTSTNSTVTSFTYDSQGNRIRKSDGTTTTNYSWDVLNRMTALDNQNYSYGLDSMRESVNGTQQVYDSSGKLLTDGTNKYLWGPDGNLLAQAPLAATASTATLYALTDQMGSVYGIVGSSTGGGNSNLIASYSYSSFGVRTLLAGSDVTPIGFTSEQHDSTGFIYLRARYYDPSIGQFISADPMVNSTLDPYGYANGNPLQVIDPLGLWGTKSDWGALSSQLGVISLALTGLALGSTAASASIFLAPVTVPLAAASAELSIISGWLGVIAGTVSTSMECNESGLESADCIGSSIVLGVGVFGATLGSFGVFGMVKNPLKELILSGIPTATDGYNTARSKMQEPAQKCQ